MNLSVLIDVLTRVREREGDLAVEVICSSEGIGGSPLVIVEDGELLLDMDRLSSYSGDPRLETTP